MNETRTQQSLRVLCTNGLKSVFDAEGDHLRRTTGIHVAADFGSTKKFADQVTAGTAPDLVILTDEAIDALVALGKVAPGRIDIARSFIGVAVRKGAPRPEIGTADAFIATLRAARAISRSRHGASGQHFASLLKKLALEAELNDKIKVYDGRAGQACAEGEVDIAIQQISELMPVSGLDIVGPLPPELQKVTVFSAGIGADTNHRAAAESLVAFLTDPARRDVLRANGLEPA